MPTHSVNSFLPPPSCYLICIQSTSLLSTEGIKLKPVLKKKDIIDYNSINNVP